MYDTTGNIIRYEAGELDEEEVKSLFQALVNSGLAWRLQGHYGRTARALLDAGWIQSPASSLNSHDLVALEGVESSWISVVGLTRGGNVSVETGGHRFVYTDTTKNDWQTFWKAKMDGASVGHVFHRLDLGHRPHVVVKV